MPFPQCAGEPRWRSVVRGGEREPGREQLVKNHAERIQVGSGVERPVPTAEGLQRLRGHVWQRAAHRPEAVNRGREIEIEQHRPSVVGEEYVRGFQVAMKDAPAM